MISAWGVEHGDGVSKALWDKGDRKRYKRDREDIRSSHQFYKDNDEITDGINAGRGTPSRYGKGKVRRGAWRAGEEVKAFGRLVKPTRGKN